MKKCMIKIVFSNGQGRGIIVGVTRLLLLGPFYTIQTKGDQTFWRGVYFLKIHNVHTYLLKEDLTSMTYTMVSIKLPVLLSILVQIFLQKSLLNNLVYLKLWESHKSKKPIIFFWKRSYEGTSQLPISISNAISLRQPSLMIEPILGDFP